MLKATPHAVLAGKMEGIGRTTLAIFMEPSSDRILEVPEGRNLEDIYYVSNLVPLI